MKRITTYLLQDDYYHLLYDYLTEWNRFVPMNVGAWFKYQETYAQWHFAVQLDLLRKPDQEVKQGDDSMILVFHNIVPVNGSFVDGLHQMSQVDKDKHSEFFEAKIIDGSNCYWLRTYGMLSYVSINGKDSERSITWENGERIAKELKHIFVMRMDFVVRQKSKFEIKKETVNVSEVRNDERSEQSGQAQSN